MFENYSSVMNDVTVMWLLLIMIKFGLFAKIVDIEIAFLYRKLEEETYMEWPHGMKNIVNITA